MDGVVNVVPVPRAAPPDDAAYQLMVPTLAVADKSSVPASHLLAPEELEMLGIVFTVAVTIVRVALVHEVIAVSTK